jgi:hypothetical protein
MKSRSLRGLISLLSASALIAAFAVASLPAGAFAAAGAVAYNSVPAVLPGNVPSEPFEADQTSNFGDSVVLASGTGRVAASVDVVMSSWGCEFGHWNTGDCLTTPGATFSHDITLNLYSAAAPGGAPSGPPLLTQTRTFNIAYRPSANALCTGGDAGKWRSSGGTCYSGFATTISFELSATPITLPDNLAWTVAYNTTHSGAAPIGEAASCYTSAGGCGYDSLNVGTMSFTGQPSIGSDPVADVAVRNDALESGWTGYRPLATIRTFEALGACLVTTSGTTPVTYTLLADCTTDHTIVVPQNAGGSVFDGNGHKITGVDPTAGHFLGAVVQAQSGPKNITVKNLTVTVSSLTDACDAGADRLRGILFDAVGGTISNNNVTDIEQGAAGGSGCQEGNAIEVRNAPFDNTGIDFKVAISGNTVSDYQKTGILANGSVAATITSNTIVGDGPITYIAQNGIQVGFGGTAIVKSNSATANWYTPSSDIACGFLIFQADGVSASSNNFFNNERNQCNFGKGGGTFKASNP